MSIRLLGRDLPFYHIETWIAILLILLNILIQTSAIYVIYNFLKKIENKP